MRENEFLQQIVNREVIEMSHQFWFLSIAVFQDYFCKHSGFFFKNFWMLVERVLCRHQKSPKRKQIANFLPNCLRKQSNAEHSTQMIRSSKKALKFTNAECMPRFKNQKTRALRCLRQGLRKILA